MIMMMRKYIIVINKIDKDFMVRNSNRPNKIPAALVMNDGGCGDESDDVDEFGNDQALKRARSVGPGICNDCPILSARKGAGEYTRETVEMGTSISTL